MILGIDPGKSTGCALINNTHVLLTCTLATDRLNVLECLVDMYKPAIIAVEAAFCARNSKAYGQIERVIGRIEQVLLGHDLVFVSAKQVHGMLERLAGTVLQTRAQKKNAGRKLWQWCRTDHEACAIAIAMLAKRHGS